MLCVECFGVAWCTAEAMCQGKRRLGRDAAVDRAASSTIVKGKPMLAYQCRVCDWWHVGNEKRSRAEYKRRSLTVELLVATMHDRQLAALRRRWDSG